MRDQKSITYSQEKIEVQSVYSVEPDFVSSLLKKGHYFSKMAEAILRPIENKVKKKKSRRGNIIWLSLRFQMMRRISMPVFLRVLRE